MQAPSSSGSHRLPFPRFGYHRPHWQSHRQIHILKAAQASHSCARCTKTHNGHLHALSEWLLSLKPAAHYSPVPSVCRLCQEILLFFSLLYSLNSGLCNRIHLLLQALNLFYCLSFIRTFCRIGSPCRFFLSPCPARFRTSSIVAHFPGRRNRVLQTTLIDFFPISCYCSSRCLIKITLSKRIFTIRFAACRIIRDLSAGRHHPLFIAPRSLNNYLGVLS